MLSRRYVDTLLCVLRISFLGLYSGESRQELWAIPLLRTWRLTVLCPHCLDTSWRLAIKNDKHAEGRFEVGFIQIVHHECFFPLMLLAFFSSFQFLILLSRQNDRAMIVLLYSRFLDVELNKAGRI